MKVIRKKHLLTIFILFFIFHLYGTPKQSSQIIKSGHWIYDDLTILASETKMTMYLETQPLSIGEIQFFVNKIDYDKLSNSGKIVYDKVTDFINKEDDFIKSDKGFRLFGNISLTPEFYYKSNDNISWSFNPYFKADPFIVPIIIGFSDFLTIEADLNVGKNTIAFEKPDNFTNITLNGGQMDFSLPDFAYFSGSYVFDTWGIAAHMGKEGKKIGHTSLGSIIYNDTFNTDFYMQLNLFSNWLKYSMDVIQVQPSKFLYLHQINLHPFKNFNISVIEGSLINSSFELRYLNPLMLMHQFGSWLEYPGANKDFYGESNFCAYLAFTFEYLPFKNLRIYGLYAQNEILDLGGSRSDAALSVPDSLGGQLGIEYFIPLPNLSYLKTGIEAVYTSPYLYVKHSPDWSLYRTRNDMQGGGKVNSWIGSPFGPDCFALQTKIEYETNKKWSVGLDYVFSIHGENTIENLFNETNIYKRLKTGIDESKLTGDYSKDRWAYDEFWLYYPSVKYEHGDDKSAAVADSRNMWMHGILEYKNRITLKGHYNILDNLDLSGQFNYTFVFNNKNNPGEFAQGVELAVAVSYDLF